MKVINVLFKAGVRGAFRNFSDFGSKKLPTGNNHETPDINSIIYRYMLDFLTRNVFHDSLSKNDEMFKRIAKEATKEQIWPMRLAIRGVDGKSLLHDAVKDGHKELVQFLLDKDALANVRDSEDETPLYDAVRNGHKELAQLLLDNRADVMAKNKYGDTPLHIAASMGDKDSAQFLLDKGADVNAKNDEGETPLHSAAYNGHEGIAKLLIDNDANVKARNDDGHTPLQIAAFSKHKEVVDVIKHEQVPTPNINCPKSNVNTAIGR